MIVKLGYNVPEVHLLYDTSHTSSTNTSDSLLKAMFRKDVNVGIEFHKNYGVGIEIEVRKIVKKYIELITDEYVKNIKNNDNYKLLNELFINYTNGYILPDVMNEYYEFIINNL